MLFFYVDLDIAILTRSSYKTVLPEYFISLINSNVQQGEES